MREPVYNEAFRKALETLNPAQKEAVEQIEGPVLVIAGPGTGKTQILAARIGNILLRTDSAPHNILCLTYTEAGVVAMRKRLLQFIGPDAYRVHIHTFHSFGNMVIQENLEYFGLRALEPLSDLERAEIIHEIIDEMKPDNPLKRFKGEVYFEKDRLLGLFELIKKENWQPAVMQQLIREYVKDLPYKDEFIYKKSGKGYQKGDVKQKQVDEVTEQMTKLSAAIDCYDIYNQKLKDRNRYDFADMILWVLRAFRENENLLRNYQERYLYYLVDEFQDTSGAQSELLQQLIDYWEEPNVFVVGDDDQSIYAFQDANVRNILHFSNKYQEGLHRVMMVQNYRSNQFILDLAGKLISNNRERLVNEVPGLEKRLIASNPERLREEVKPEIRAYFNTTHETVGIVKDILGLQQKGVPLSEIAVIYRNHRQAEDMARFLQTSGVPLQIKKRLNVLEQPLVIQILEILRYLKEEGSRAHSGEHRLFEILHFPFFGLRPLDIARLSLELSRLNFGERKSSFRELMARKKEEKADLFNPGGDRNPFRRASADIEHWLSIQHDCTLQQLIEKIINRGGILRMALESPEKVWHMEVIHSFFEFVKDECARNTSLRLPEFLNLVDLMLQNRLEVPVYRIQYAAEGVNFITAHSSKGLEFDYVYVIGCQKRVWNSNPRNTDYKMPDTIAPRKETDETEESRRLFYVALTRAKKQLVVSWAEHNNDGKEQERSPFVAEIEEAGIAREQQVHVNNEALIEFQLKVVDEPEMPEVSLIDEEYLKETLEKYTMSVTHLSNYLRCPLSFYFDNLIRVPRAKAPSMTFGSAVHYALEKLFLLMLEDPDKQFPDMQRFLRDFEWYMRRNQDSFTDKEFELRLEYGRRILPDYYRKYADSWNKVVVVERNMRHLEVRGIPINGKIDKLEFDGKEVTLVDYKTGDWNNAKKKFDPPVEHLTEEEHTHETRYGGDYWRQAVFYKILMDNDRTRDWKMKEAVFDFVEPEKKTGEYVQKSLSITAEEVAIVTGQIEDTYRRIKNHEFPGCGQLDCDWCNFARNHYQLSRELAPSDEELEKPEFKGMPDPGL